MTLRKRITSTGATVALDAPYQAPTKRGYHTTKATYGHEAHKSDFDKVTIEGMTTNATTQNVGQWRYASDDREQQRIDALLQRRHAATNKTAKPHKASAPKPAKREVVATVTHLSSYAAQGSYRQSQALIKWARENVSGYVTPCKNAGWENIRTNIDALMQNKHFLTLARKSKYATQLRQFGFAL